MQARRHARARTHPWHACASRRRRLGRYRSCWGKTGDHDWDAEAVHDNVIYVQSADVQAVVDRGAYCKRDYTLEQFQALGKEPGTRRLVGYPPTSSLLAQSRAVLGAFAPVGK